MGRKLVLACGLIVAVGIIAGAGRGWAAADDPPAKSKGKDGTAKVDALAWMAGRWKGTMFGGPVDERWMSPTGGSMLGMCRIGSDAKRAMYEAMLIEETETGVVLYLRHFKSGLTTQETKPMAFRLTKVEADRAEFETDDEKLQFRRIVYTQPEKDVLAVRLEGGTTEKPRRAESRMERQSGD